MTARARSELYYWRHRDKIRARSRARYRADPKVRARLVAATRRRRRLGRIAERWVREWMDR